MKIRIYKHPIQPQVDNRNLGMFKARIGEVWEWVSATCVTSVQGRGLESLEVP